MIKIQPSDTVLQRWRDAFTPERDVWYWDDSPASIDTTGQQVLTRREYLDAYASIDYTNAYWHWRMPKQVQTVLVAEPNWIGSLPEHDRSLVLAKQIELDRGQMFPVTHFDSVPQELQPFVVGDKIVITRAVWMSLDQEVQFTALGREMLQWDDTDCYPTPAGTPDHISRIANEYGDQHGTNCLSTTAYCITGQRELRHKWMFQPEFLAILEQHGFERVHEPVPSPGDVIGFMDNGTLIHAAYCLTGDLFVNKNGQSMFNPVRIVNRAMLDADWKNADPVIYRRSVPNN